MEHENEQSDSEAAEERETDAGKQSADAQGDGRNSDDDGEKDSPGKREPTEEEKEQQRAEDARAAQERLEEVRDAPPEQHGALQADALGSTIILVGGLFIIFGVIVALAFSPWGWAGVAIGVVEVIIGQLIRSGAFRRGSAG